MAAPIPAAYLSSGGTFDRDHCIKAILDYVRGYNIRNEVIGTTSVTVNRPRMLGDIFHSSPVLVDPPVDQFFCDLWQVAADNAFAPDLLKAYEVTQRYPDEFCLC